MTSKPSLAHATALDEDGNVVVGGTIVSPRPTLSATALSAYEICGRRGEFYHDPTIPKGPPTANMVRGSVWHMIMEWWNIAHKANGWEFKTFYPDLATTLAEIMVESLSNMLEANGEAWTDAGMMPIMTNELLDVASDLSRMIEVFAAGSDDMHWTVPGVEVIAHEELLYVENFYGTATDFVGYADAVVRVPGIPGVVGIDYKATSKAWGGAKGEGDPRKIIQPPLYAEAWQVMHDEPMDWFAMDVMTKAGKFQRVWVPTGQRARQPFLRRWHGVAADIEMHTLAGVHFPTNPSHYLCSVDYCDFWNICEMGEPLTQDINQQVQVTIGGTP